MSTLLTKPQIDPQSKLAIGRSTFVKGDPTKGDVGMNRLLQEGEDLGAAEGMQRLKLICEQHDQLSPNAAYLWIDPGSIQREIEEAQLSKKRVEVVHFFRNFFSLAPLIVTWTALFEAVSNYQTYLNMPGADRTKPFLELWQSGFNHLTWISFTVAAGTDVVLLFLYLVCILFTNEYERRAHMQAVSFVKKLQTYVDNLMKYIAEDSNHIGDKSDIENVVDAVKKVVESATDSVKQVVEQTSNANKQIIEQTSNANKQVIENVEKSFEAAISQAQTKMQQAVGASEKAITNANSRVERMFNDDVSPLMKSFRNDMTTFQQELGKYQTRLDDLTKSSQLVASASQKLSTASEELTKNADRYATIGNNIDAQIASLNLTQREVVSQIGAVASNISTAAGSMTSVTSSMKNATNNIEVVAKQLNVEMQTTLQKMTINVDGFTQSMNQGGTDLRTTIQSLDINIRNVSRSLEQVGVDLRATSGQMYNTAVFLDATLHRDRNFIRRLLGRAGRGQPQQRGPIK